MIIKLTLHNLELLPEINIGQVWELRSINRQDGTVEVETDGGDFWNKVNIKEPEDE